MEPKKEIGSLDLRFLVKELRQEISGAVFRKIYQYGGSKDKKFIFGLFVSGKGEKLLYVDSSKMYLISSRKVSPSEPPSFCMFLRKHLMGKRIKDIIQHGFDRIVEIFLDEYIVIFEMMHPGNVILTDRSYNIIMPLEIQKWRHREIRPKSPYKFPPPNVDPFNIHFDTFFNHLKKQDKKLVVVLATDLGFGSVYANEICVRAEVNPDIPGNQVTPSEASVVFDTFTNLVKEKPSPSIYDGAVSPIALKSAGPPKETKESFSAALETYFSALEIKESEPTPIERKREEIQRIVEQHKEAEKKWEGKKEETRSSADMMYSHYSDIQLILEGIRKAKQSGMTWEEIKNRISSEDTEQSRMIKEIREHEGKIVLDIDGKEIEIDIFKTVQEGAGEMYDRSKFAKAKVERIGESLEQHEEKLEDLEEKEAESLEIDFDKEKALQEQRSKIIEKEKVKEEKKEWYEKFRWFFSSEGMLVIAGRNADQNEMVIKKYTDPRDLVYHADIQGAAFVVIKSMGIDITDETKKEAAEFAAANCKAWSKGLGTVDVYEVKPEQISKSPPSGMSLGKGAFMIYGERVWYKDLEIKISIGVKLDREYEISKVISGPVISVRKNSDYFVTIRPGFKKELELARTIKNKILIKAKPEDKFLIEKIQLEDFVKHIPSGTGEVIDFGE